MDPIKPFEPIWTDVLPSGKEWVYQVKWDGVRMLLYKLDDKVELVNRNLNNRTKQYPELLDLSTYCSAASVILDGEIIAMQDGKPSFHEVMKRDRMKRSQLIQLAVKDRPIIFMIFDILYLDGKWVIEEQLVERQKLLSTIIKSTDSVQIVENFTDGEALFGAVQSKGLEGVVAKDLRKPYSLNGKDGRWQKLKCYKDLIAVVGGFLVKGSELQSLALGLYDKSGNLCYIGRVGKGRYKYEEWKVIKQFLEKALQSETPFAKKVGNNKTYQWIQPIYTVKVTYLEWTESMTLRQPLLEAFVEHDPQKCRMEFE